MLSASSKQLYEAELTAGLPKNFPTVLTKIVAQYVNPYEIYLKNYDENKDNNELMAAKELIKRKGSAKCIDTFTLRILRCGCIKTFTYLLENKYIRADKIVKQVTSDGKTAYYSFLLTALKYPHHAIALMLLENYPLSIANLNFAGKKASKWHTDFYGSALMCAVDNLDIKILTLLLQKGADPDAQNFQAGASDNDEMSRPIPLIIYIANHPDLEPKLKQVMLKIVLPFSKVKIDQLPEDSQKLIYSILEKNLQPANSYLSCSSIFNSKKKGQNSVSVSAARKQNCVIL